jgi:hypothetical protein
MPNLSPEIIESNLYNLGKNDLKLNSLLNHLDYLENQFIKITDSIEYTNRKLELLALDTSKVNSLEEKFDNESNIFNSKFQDLQILASRFKDLQNLVNESHKFLLINDLRGMIIETLKNNHETLLSLAKAKDPENHNFTEK